MPLADPGTVRPLLVCPRCRCALVAEPTAFRCAAPHCALHQVGSFPVIGGSPVLVDFERSVLPRPTAGRPGTGPPRPALERLPPRLRGLWRPVNRVAVRNTGRLLRALPGPAPTVLVVGGATVGNGTAALYSDPRIRLIGFDIAPSPWTQFVADAHQIPLADRSVDAVVVQAVLEHVLDPALVVAEIHRVLTAGGLVYAETPFLQQVHAGPYDFTRFTLSGHRYLFRRFAELDAGAVAGPGTQLLWSLDHLARGLTRSATAGRLARGLLGWLRLLDAAVPPRYAEDSACACYFLGRKRADGMSPAQIVEYYRGAQPPG
ncbi:SAM-dependent methyltransferase [Kitasatospora sp. MAP12-15]|uniref:class I SAM-dependent methyltransferase n=1 Tax=unclassified Kitasatospora TaxID=2633591 RepID=UPI002473FD51|nr:class I SAM-dependent methyltransferase [Kitasatospora sp. MAP12-44]MDH6108524.1 SAM-dependent methyltransferase [Kitasatospora sp. MAP12-44]